MTEQKNSLKWIVVKLNDVLKTASAQLQDVEAKKEVLRALGLDPAGATQVPAIPASAFPGPVRIRVRS